MTDPLKPIDSVDSIPPPSGVEHDHLTQDIESALRVALLEWIDVVAKTHSLGRRQAAMIMLKELRDRR